MSGEKIIRSKNVFTGTGDAPVPASILVKDREISALLPWEEAGRGEYAGFPVEDYGEQLILPSFIDAHTHLFSGAIGASRFVCDTLTCCTSEEECAQMIRRYADAHPDLKRIRGSGWFVGAWNDAPLPSRRSLDAVLPERPVYMNCADGHSFWVNSKALEEMNLPADYTPPTGEACRFEDGSFTGLFIEPDAYAPALEKYMQFTREELLEIHRSFQELLASEGIAAVSEMMGAEYGPEQEKNCALIHALEEEGALKSHVYNYGRLFGHTDFTPFYDLKKRYDSAHFHLAGVKGFLDGVTETYTGLLLEPYTDRPDTCGEGVPLRDKDLLMKEVAAANRAGIQVRLHCIADGSVRMALDLFAHSAEVNGDTAALCNTIEHIENIHPDDLPRFRQLGVLPSMQPYHLVLSCGGKVWRLGKERCRYEFPWRSVYDSCGRLALGTDYPVVDINPFRTIHAALTRCDDEGNETGENPKEETLPMEVILKGYTADAARAYHAGEYMGTLSPGKLANLIVLSDNLFAVPPEQILKTGVAVNYFEGEMIYHE